MVSTTVRGLPKRLNPPAFNRQSNGPDAHPVSYPYRRAFAPLDYEYVGTIPTKRSVEMVSWYRGSCAGRLPARCLQLALQFRAAATRLSPRSMRGRAAGIGRIGRQLGVGVGSAAGEPAVPTAIVAGNVLDCRKPSRPAVPLIRTEAERTVSVPSRLSATIATSEMLLLAAAAAGRTVPMASSRRTKTTRHPSHRPA